MYIHQSKVTDFQALGAEYPYFQALFKPLRCQFFQTIFHSFEAGIANAISKLQMTKNSYF